MNSIRIYGLVACVICCVGLIGFNGTALGNAPKKDDAATMAASQNEAPSNNILYVLQGSSVQAVNLASLQVTTVTNILPSQADKSIRMIYVPDTGKSIYAVEGLTSESVFGPTQVIQLDTQTKARRTLCDGSKFVQIIVSPTAQYILTMIWADKRSEFSELWSTIDVKTGSCTQRYTDPNDDLVLPLLWPKWISNNSYLALALGMILYAVQVPDNRNTLVLDTWVIGDYAGIPGTHRVLVAGHPKSQDTPDTYFTTVDMDTRNAVLLPYHWSGGIDRASMSTSYDGKYFIICAQGCKVLELATGKIVLTANDQNKIMAMVWTPNSDQLITILNTHPEQVASLDFLTSKLRTLFVGDNIMGFWQSN